MMPLRINAATLNLDQVRALLKKGGQVPSDIREQVLERLSVLRGFAGSEEEPSRPSGA